MQYVCVYVKVEDGLSGKLHVQSTIV